MAFSFPLRVLVVDDHAGIRAGIARLVDAEFPRMHTVGTAASAGAALAGAREHQPHVVVLDVDLNGEDGLALIPVLQLGGQCRVVVLSSLSDPQVSALALRLGAYACVHKAAPAAELVDSIARAGAALGAAPLPANAGGDLSRLPWSKHP